MNNLRNNKKLKKVENVEKFISRLKRDGEIQYLVEVSLRNKPGKKPVRPKKRGYASNLTLARKLRTQLMEELHNEIFGSPTMDEFFPKYLEEVRLYKQPATAENERLAFEGHILPQFGERKLSEVTTSDLNSFLHEYLKDRASSTKRNYRKFLRGIFKSAQAKRYIAIDPTQELQPIPINEGEKSFLRVSQLEHLLGFALDNRHEWASHYMVAAYTGMRVNEQRGLRWSCIDWERNLIHVKFTVDNRGNEKSFTKNRTTRWVPLLPPLRKHLEELYRLRKPLPEEFVLENLPKWRTGEQGKVLKDLLQILGLPEMRYYDFRASFACFLAEQLPLSQVSEILGHHSIEMTAKYLRKYGVRIGKVIDQLSYIPTPKINSINEDS